MNRPRSIAVGALGCGALLASLATPTFAQSGGARTGTHQSAPGKQRATVSCGKITAIADDALTVKPDTGAAQVIKLDATTRYLALGLAAARHGLQSGDYARALGGAAGPARIVQWAETNLCLKAPSGNQRFVGQVQSATPNSLTFVDRAGNVVTVTFNQGTRFYMDGKLVQNPPAFTKGEVVAILAHRETNSTFTALTVAVGHAAPHGVRLAGVIASFTASSITLQIAGQDAMTVNLLPTTRYLVGGKLSTLPPTFSKGEKIRVLARVEQDKTLNAVLVAVPNS